MRHTSLVLILQIGMAGILPGGAVGQDPQATDTLPGDSVRLDAFALDTLTAVGTRVEHHTSLPEVIGTRIFAAKKTDVVRMTAGDANLARNVGRMAFSRIPGANIWDMSGAGTQINLSTRGTDAHRQIEMNMRQNGYTTSSDPVGYPENHYTPALQAVQRIELVRGSSSLQFGNQFGGMMNYVMKTGDPDEEFELESEQTFGSYNFFNSYNAVGGSTDRFRYYAYFDNRTGDGWRDNSTYNYNSMYGNVRYEISDRQTLALQLSRMSYREQIAGGLTDEMFEEDPRQTNRSRNFFSPTINIPAAIHNFEVSPSTSIETMVYGLWGDRSSVQFIATPNVEDTVNTALGTLNPRQVDRDFYKSVTLESTLLHEYDIGDIDGAVTTGIRYFTGRTDRTQDGEGTTGSHFTFRLTGDYGIDLDFDSQNYAAFAENLLNLHPRLKLTTGARYEVIRSSLDGVIDDATVPVSYEGNRDFALFGAGLQFAATPSNHLYFNATQSYRPYLYSFITPADQVSEIDPNLEDARGYQVDLGYRGSVGDLATFDVSAYRAFYGDRIGTVTRTGSGGSTQLFTTNVGDAVAKGIESYVELSLVSLTRGSIEDVDLRLFNSLGYTHARYRDATISSGGSNVSLDGNMVENVPEWNNRAGLEFSMPQLTSTLQYSYVSRHFSDANETAFNPTATTGVIPAYGVWDWALNWNFFQEYSVAAGINNVADSRYFSRRIDRYPGPGILPAPGRTFYVSVGLGLD